MDVFVRSPPQSRAGRGNNPFGRSRSQQGVDPVSQVALGAAVGEAVLGRKIGRRAPRWGGRRARVAPESDPPLPP